MKLANSRLLRFCYVGAVSVLLVGAVLSYFVGGTAALRTTTCAYQIQISEATIFYLEQRKLSPGKWSLLLDKTDTAPRWDRADNWGSSDSYFAWPANAAQPRLEFAAGTIDPNFIGASSARYLAVRVAIWLLFWPLLLPILVVFWKCIRRKSCERHRQGFDPVVPATQDKE